MDITIVNYFYNLSLIDTDLSTTIQDIYEQQKAARSIF